MNKVEYELVCYSKTLKRNIECTRYGLYKVVNGNRTLVNTSDYEEDLLREVRYNNGQTIINLINCTTGTGRSIMYK